MNPWLQILVTLVWVVSWGWLTHGILQLTCRVVVNSLAVNGLNSWKSSRVLDTRFYWSELLMFQSAMAEVASCQVLCFKPTCQPYLNDGLDCCVMWSNLSLRFSPLSLDMFNNTEVDGRIIEVRHDKMGWLLTLLAEQVSCLLNLFLNYKLYASHITPLPILTSPWSVPCHTHTALLCLFVCHLVWFFTVQFLHSHLFAT